jgi:TPR repeat protein
VLSTATYAYKQGQRPELLPLARAGDPQAQTEVGKSYCCFGPGFSVFEATKWYCEAATQGHAEAYFELGRVYSGETVRSISPTAHVVGRATARRDRGLALMFFEQAERLGFSRARAKADTLRGRLDDEEQLAFGGYSANPAAAPCRYSEVFPDARPGFRPPREPIIR